MQLIELLLNFLNKFKIFNIFSKIFSDNYIEISEENESYDTILNYVSNNFCSNIKGYEMSADFDSSKYIIKELKESYVKDIFEFDNKKYKMKISFHLHDNKGKQDDYHDHTNIFIKSTASIGIITKYINHIVCKANDYQNITDISNELQGLNINTLSLFQIMNSGGTKKDKNYRWKNYKIITNKNIANTFTSENVKKYFIDDIEKFLKSQVYYMKKGIPYKRGYILYGEPGCGKTSLIKIVASYHKIPIFIVDMSILENNSTFIKLVNSISNHVKQGKPHIVVYEDIDRCSMFSHRGYSKITEDKFLNILDGIDENYGRINIITTNDILRVETMQALLRPGRIDVQVKVSYCTEDQIFKILELYLEIDITNIKLPKNLKITPATLIHIILLVNDFDKVMKILSQQIDFSKIIIEKIIDKYITNELPQIEQTDKSSKLNSHKKKYKKKKSNTIKREKHNKDYDKLMVEYKVLEHDIEIDSNINVENAEIDHLQLEKKKIDIKILKLQIENMEKLYKVDKLDIFDKDYDEFSKYIWRNKTVKYSKLNEMNNENSTEIIDENSTNDNSTNDNYTDDNYTNDSDYTPDPRFIPLKQYSSESSSDD